MLPPVVNVLVAARHSAIAAEPCTPFRKRLFFSNLQNAPSRRTAATSAGRKAMSVAASGKSAGRPGGSRLPMGEKGQDVADLLDAGVPWSLHLQLHEHLAVIGRIAVHFLG